MRNHAQGDNGVPDARSDINYYVYDENSKFEMLVLLIITPYMINNRDRVFDCIFEHLGQESVPSWKIVYCTSEVYLVMIEKDSSYPDYLVYNFTDPTDLFEGIHNHGYDN